MRKLFGNKGIHLLTFTNEDNEVINLAYNEDLLRRNVLIEFVGVYTADQEWFTDEVGVFAIHQDKDVIYHYVLYGSYADLGPLPLLRLISDAIDFIGFCDETSLSEDLKSISTGFHEISYGDGMQELFEDHFNKFARVHEAEKSGQDKSSG